MAVGPGTAVPALQVLCKMQTFLIGKTPENSPSPRKYRVQKAVVTIKKKKSRIYFKQVLFLKVLIIEQVVVRAGVSECPLPAVFCGSLILSLSGCWL